MGNKGEKKDYIVSFDMKNSHEVRVSATTTAEAKEKGFKKIERIRNKKSSYVISVDEY